MKNFTGWICEILFVNIVVAAGCNNSNSTQAAWIHEILIDSQVSIYSTLVGSLHYNTLIDYPCIAVIIVLQWTIMDHFASNSNRKS